jgi:hypothetical protein
MLDGMGAGRMKGNGGWNRVIWKKPHAKAGKNSGIKHKKWERGVVEKKKHNAKKCVLKNRSVVLGC